MHMFSTLLCQSAILCTERVSDEPTDQVNERVTLDPKEILNGCEQSNGNKMTSVQEAVVTEPQAAVKQTQSVVNRPFVLNGTLVSGNSSMSGPLFSGIRKVIPPMDLKALQSTTSVANGNIRLLASKNTIGEKNAQSLDSNAKDALLSRTPVLVKSSKKVKMSTVAKRVPLINTVGNCSKLIPLPPSSQSQATHVSAPHMTVSLSPGVVSVSSKSSHKKKSILEAMLTGPVSNTSNCALPDCESGVPTSNVPKSLSPVAPSSEQPCIRSEQGLKRTTQVSQDENESEFLEPSSKKLKTSANDPSQRKAVLSFERGTTRLAAMEFRNVTMVDVGVQVFIPESESEVKESAPSSNPAISTGLSGSAQPPVSFPQPVPQKQIVFVDTMSGKKVLAIPNRLLDARFSPKTVLVGAKPVKIQTSGSPARNTDVCTGKESLDSSAVGHSIRASDLKSINSSPSANFILSSPSQSILKESNSIYLTVASGNHKTRNSSADVITAMSSLSTDTVTTPSGVSFPSKSSPLSESCNISDFVVDKSQVPSTLLHSVLTSSCIVPETSESTSVSKTLSGKAQATSSNSLILPLNRSVEFTNVKTPINSQRKLSSLSSSSKSTPVRTLPNTTSLFILLPNTLTEENKNCKVMTKHEAVVEGLEHEIGEGINFTSPVLQRFINQKSKDRSPSSKKQCLESMNVDNSSGAAHNSTDDLSPVNAHESKAVCSDNISSCNMQHSSVMLKNEELTNKMEARHQKSKKLDSIQQNPTTFFGNSLGTIMAPKANRNSITGSKDDVDKLLRNAYSDFKNCLLFNMEGKLPIHVAVENNDISTVKRQCIVLKARNTSINIPNSKDETPLQLALYCGNSSMVKLLLQQGADAKCIDHEGNSTLHLAVERADDAVNDLLLTKQLNKELINGLNDEGFSALHLAARSNKVNATSLLVEHGAEVDLPDGKSGRTALYHAVERKHYMVQKVLMNYGADMRGPTFTGSTPLTVTRNDTLAQLTGCHDAVAEIIDSATLLQSHGHRKSKKVK